MTAVMGTKGSQNQNVQAVVYTDWHNGTGALGEGFCPSRTLHLSFMNWHVGESVGVFWGPFLIS